MSHLREVPKHDDCEPGIRALNGGGCVNPAHKQDACSLPVGAQPRWAAVADAINVDPLTRGEIDPHVAPANIFTRPGH